MEILDLIQRGEDSRSQFNANMNNPEQLAQEFVAFSNTLDDNYLSPGYQRLKMNC